MDNLQRQREELMALKSIYEDTVLNVDEEKMTGRFLAYPHLTKSPFICRYSLTKSGIVVYIVQCNGQSKLIVII